MTGSPEAPRKATWRDLPRRWWVVSLYYAEGFPYSLVRLMSTAYFKDHGASLQAVGMTSLLGIPWVLKFLWAPLVDAFSTKRRWLLSIEGAVVVGLVLIGLASLVPNPLVAGAVVFFLLAAVAATHDIAIDGYYLEALDRTDQARFVGFQSAAYRVAMISGGGGVAWLCGRYSYLTGYLVAAALLGTLWGLHATRLPRIETVQRPGRELLDFLFRPRIATAFLGTTAAIVALWAVLRDDRVEAAIGPLAKISAPSWIVILLLVGLATLAARAPALKKRLYASDSHYALAFIDYLDRPRIGLVLAFIVTYRIGEAQVQSMAYPFLKDIGITLEQYGLAHNTFGILATIVGSIIGGFLIARFGLKRCMWPFVLALNSLNVLYMLLAWNYRALLENSDAGRADFWLVCALITAEAFGAGFGNAALTVFIFRTTRPRFKAAHFAIGTGLMNIAGTLAGVVSGFVAAKIGFVWFFAFTAVATIPNMCMIPFLPFLDGDPDRESSTDAATG
jgi:PAT family beta-lactamase induction signal transducer AmpG